MSEATAEPRILWEDHFCECPKFKQIDGRAKDGLAMQVVLRLLLSKKSSIGPRSVRADSGAAAFRSNEIRLAPTLELPFIS